ncbi:hypothetical protein BTJ68_05933 [Hortaea werneckii EXF-2000]|uniref:Integral membrane protein n=1 Tax=Hortaea werneckii EXF-2000 TaxID=1157616 RepID=A0A1Z5TBB1_HORWE|nr:hypothetical protein BTJ68_05933 [Hortaea werneckii EXF-2000]
MRRHSSYTPPPFPSLYWPFPVAGTQTAFLYDAYSMFKFTLYWTLIFTLVRSSGKNWKVIWVVPIIYLIIGGVEAVIAGSVVGGVLGGVYSAGFFRMSTWIPLSWGVINAMVLILSSFAIQGGL